MQELVIIQLSPADVDTILLLAKTHAPRIALKIEANLQAQKAGFFQCAACTDAPEMNEIMQNGRITK